VKCAPDFAGDLPLPPQIRRDRIERSLDGVVLEGEAVEADQVVEMDPGKPLPPAAQGSAGKEAEGEHHQAERRGATTEDEGGAYQHHPHPKRLRLARRGLPLLAHASQKRPARRALLGDRLIAALAVVIDARGADEDPRPLSSRRLLKGLDDRPGGLEPAVEDLGHPAFGPATRADARADKVHHAVRSSQLIRPSAGGGPGVPLHQSHAWLRACLSGSATEDGHVMAVADEAGR
jgi:hypothetical protein